MRASVRGVTTTALALLGALAWAAACGDGAADGEIEPCPGRLEPLEPRGEVLTVGDGIPAGCTGQTLRDAVEAIAAADGGGTVLFDCGGEHTVVLDSPLLVSGTLLLDGQGLITLSGGGAVRVIEADHHADLTVQRLAIVDGLADDSGAGILHPWYGALRAIDVRFENNRCTSLDHDVGGGAVFAGGLSEAVFSGCAFTGNSASNGGGLLNRGSDLTIVDCVFAGNEATSSAASGQYGNGGGLYIDGMNYDDPGDLFLCGTSFEGNRATQHGSAVFSYFYEGSGSLVDRCTFVGNHFDGSPSGGAGGLYHQVGPLLLRDSTFAGNRSDLHAAGLFVGSGSSARVVSCTFADNAVPEVGAAIFSGASPVDIESSTFFGNSADYGPAIFQGEEAVISLQSTILANNTTPTEYSALSCHATLVDRGGNLQWPKQKPGGGDDLPCAEGIEFVDPGLLPLADNGGPTPTMAIPAGSPAVDFADDCPEFDQRGLPRSGACDCGAFEFQG
jgi:hypothetical protein